MVPQLCKNKKEQNKNPLKKMPALWSHSLYKPLQYCIKNHKPPKKLSVPWSRYFVKLKNSKKITPKNCRSHGPIALYVVLQNSKIYHSP
jgi:hypothetical protein